jgi:hypothetical protein
VASTVTVFWLVLIVNDVDDVVLIRYVAASAADTAAAEADAVEDVADVDAVPADVPAAA